MAKFFISCAIGFENELIDELKTFWFEMMDLDGQPTRSLLPEVEIYPGGIEADIPEHLGFQVNLFSKIANRILIRIHHFEARYFDQFEKEFKKLELENWIEPQTLILKIETHKSRINNQKSIEESVSGLLKEKKFKVATTAGDDEIGHQILYIRNSKDRVTISLDTSGLHLHKRGYAVYRGEAPLREVFAAYLFRQLLKNTSLLQNLSLIDPFVGSGTILFEAQSIHQPQLKRKYAWQSFKKLPKLFKSETWMQNYKWLSPARPVSYFGIDQDAKSISNLEKNQKVFNDIFNQGSIQIKTWVADSLKVDLNPLRSLENAWLITNPPYGHRLQEGRAIEVLERFEVELPLKGLIVLHPESWNLNLKKLRLVSKIDFKNQGLKLKLSVYSA